MISDDHALVARMANGDEEALQHLYTRYCPRLRRYLWHRLHGDSSLVEEVLQEVFFAAWRYARSYRGEATVGAWLFRIAHNNACRTWRDSQRRTEGYLVPLPLDEGDETSFPSQMQNPSHEDDVIARLSLDHALQALSEKHREVLSLMFQQGFSLDQIAHILDVPIGTVKSRISYARRALLKELTPTTSQEDHAL